MNQTNTEKNGKKAECLDENDEQTAFTEWKGLPLDSLGNPFWLRQNPKKKLDTDGVICLPCDVQTSLDNFADKPKEYKPHPYKRKYVQNWSSYNDAQTHEKFMFLKILSEIVDSINIRNYGTNRGRPPLLLSDMIKCCCIKVYDCSSARRAISDLKIAEVLHYVNRVPHFNSLIGYFRNQYMTRFLQDLIRLTSIPLAPFETKFSPDATGFSTYNKDKWLKVRLDWHKHRDYKKLHIMTGTHTNIITSAKVTEGTSHDSPHFKELLKETATNFNIKEVSADPGYLSRENAQAIEDIGAAPYILPKKNTTALSKGHTPAWNRMINLFKENEAKFRLHYHQRSNVEATFSMVKRKFGDFVRNKTEKAQENEILCKIVCHNIAVLINAVFELKLDLEYLN